MESEKSFESKETKKITPEERVRFLASVKKTMDDIVKTHQHEHPLYKPTSIQEFQVDYDANRAAFILFEQIDTDRLTPEVRDTLLNMAGPGHPLSQYMPRDVTSEGWLGDQFRYSVWYVEMDKEPIRLYEDHSYIRPRTPSPLTGTIGRDPVIKHLKLEKDKIKAIDSQGKELEIIIK